MFKVIRLKSDPNVIRSYCEGTQSGLGEFDETLFEQVELEALPDGWTQYKEKPTAKGSDFVKFVNATFTESNRQQNRPILERMIMAHDVPKTMREWHLDNSGTLFMNVYEFIENLEEISQEEWDAFIQTVENTKGFDANNKSQIGDQLIDLANQWASTVKFEN